MPITVDQIAIIFEDRGNCIYGQEAVTQLEHALQCAELAEASGASQELVTACLLHDLGHMLSDSSDEFGEPSSDELHQYIALPFINKLFSDAVLQPIRLHVDAKRCLCATDPGYWDELSPTSKHSLELQGGIYSPEEAKVFLAHPFAKAAMQLRIWDDKAKVKGKVTPPFAHFLPIVEACVQNR
jgi:phosphonate degradation associated HDIG domain protein